MTSVLRSLIIVLVAVSVVDCSLIPRSAASRAAREKRTLLAGTVGCYKITWGKWTGNETLVLPEHILLHEELRTSPPYNRPEIAAYETRFMEPQIASFLQARGQHADWRMIGRDSVFMGWATAFNGVGLTFVRRGNELVGSGGYWSDLVGPSYPKIDAVAVREKCN